MPPRARSIGSSQTDPEHPIFTLPPYKVESVFTAYSESIDWGLTLLGIPQLWRLTKGEGAKVAILDTGVATDHPDLKKAVVKTKDFTRSRAGVGDHSGHGTHTAGIIAARENSTGVVGVAPECRLFIGKVLGDNGAGSLEAVASGIDWAIDQGADVISLSLGAPFGHPKLEAAIQRAVTANRFVIASAGNEGPSVDTVSYPAMYPNVVSVGAIDQKKKIARFSSRGTRVDIVAPGVDILSCYPPRGLAKLSGTSMAAPFVAGVVALMVAKHRALGTDTSLKTTQDLIGRLHETAIDLGPTGFDPAYGFGLIDPKRLVADTGSPPPILLTPEDLSPAGKRKVTAAFGTLRDIHAT